MLSFFVDLVMININSRSRLPMLIVEKICPYVHTFMASIAVGTLLALGVCLIQGGHSATKKMKQTEERLTMGVPLSDGSHLRENAVGLDQAVLAYAGAVFEEK